MELDRGPKGRAAASSLHRSDNTSITVHAYGDDGEDDYSTSQDGQISPSSPSYQL